MTDLLLIRRTDGCAIQEHSPLFIRTIGIIDRENYAIGSYGLQGEQKRGIRKEATGRNIEVLQKVLRRCTLQMLCLGREHIIDTSEQKRSSPPDRSLNSRPPAQQQVVPQDEHTPAHPGPRPAPKSAGRKDHPKNV